MLKAVIESDAKLWAFVSKSINPTEGINRFFFSMDRRITRVVILAWRCVIAR